jgi:hypothetical protein
MTNYGIARPTKLDGIITEGVAEEATVEALFARLAAEPSIRQPIQDAIDNPPTPAAPGVIGGPTPAAHIRAALMKALADANSAY